jgi:hypothetical protein
MSEFWVIQLISLVSGTEKSMVDGQYVVEYDPSRPGVVPGTDIPLPKCHLVVSPTWREARRFASDAEAQAYWRQVDEREPVRDDGQPNRPLTAFNIETQHFTTEAKEYEGVCGLLIQPNGSYEFRDIRGLDDMHDAIGATDMDWSAPGEVVYYCYGQALYERPRNPIATAMYRVTHDTEDPLCGPVLVLGAPTEQRDTDVPDWFVQAFLKAKEHMSQALIDKGAVPLTEKEQWEFQMKTVAAQGQMREALKAGKAVDLGGLMIGPEDAVAKAAAAQGWASSSPLPSAMDDLWDQVFGDGGQHRMKEL